MTLKILTNLLIFILLFIIYRKKSSIYTKTGDSGQSGLYNGERRAKSDITFDALGNQDELNAVLGSLCLYLLPLNYYTYSSIHI